MRKLALMVYGSDQVGCFPVYRNYVTIESGRRLVPTSLGIVLVHGYLKIDPDLVKPTMRSAVEKQLDLIAHGKAEFQSVLRHTLEVFKLKFLYFVKNIEGMDQLFEVSFSSLADSGRPFSRYVKNFFCLQNVR
jgi:DNA topoisomerase-3